MKIEALRYGTTVVLREPTMDDVEDSLRFFKDLPLEDRRYLRVDVTQRKNVEQRIRDAIEGRTYRIIALAGDKIVADGALEFSREDWSRHAGEIRAIVAHDYQRRGLGALLIKAIYGVAHQRGVEKLVAKMASPQTGARKTLERLGFHVDSVVPDYIKDVNGNTQSMVIMSCALDELSRELKGFYKTDHWPDG